MAREIVDAFRRVLSIRCSMLPLVWKCPECLAITDGEVVRIDHHNEMAELGSAAHRWAEFIDDLDSAPDVDMLAERYSVKSRELHILISLAKQAHYNHLCNIMGPDCRVEVEMAAEVEFPFHGYTHLRITGKIDRHAMKGNRALAADWKFGWRMSDPTHQLRGNGWLMMQEYPEANQFWSGVVFVRHQTIDCGTKMLTRDELNQWMDDLIWKLRNGIGKYATGSHCEFCPRKTSCDAHKADMAYHVNLYAEDGVKPLSGPPAMIGPQVAERHRMAAAVSRTAGRVQDMTREYAADCEGMEFPAGEGRMMALRQQKRKHILAREAWPVIAQHLNDDEIAQCVTVGKGKLYEAVKAKGVNIHDFEDALSEAGAFKVTSQLRLQEERDDTAE